MAGEGRLIAVAVILILLGFGVAAVQAAYFDAGMGTGAKASTNETVTVNEGNVTKFPQSDDTGLVYDRQRDVTVKNQTLNVTAQGNWTWNRHNGTLAWNDSTVLANASTVFVLFSFAEPTAEQDLTADFATLPTRVLGEQWTLLALVILVLLAAAIAGRNA